MSEAPAAEMLASHLDRSYPAMTRTAAVEAFAKEWGVTVGAVWRALRGDTTRPMVPLDRALAHIEDARKS